MARRVLEEVRQAVAERGWNLKLGDGQRCVLFQPPSRHAACWCVASMDGASGLVVQALLPMVCPPQFRGPAVELIMRLNRRSAFGRLGMEVATGEVNFQMAWPSALVQGSGDLDGLLALFDLRLQRQLPPLLMVMAAGVEVGQALAGVELAEGRLLWSDDE